MKLVVVALVMCSLSTAALADATLSGRVTDVNGQPVVGAAVVATGPDGAEVRATTDPTGSYTVVVGAAGSYAVSFQFGKTVLTAHVDVADGGAATLDSTLAVAGEIIEIQGQKPLVPAQPQFDPLAIPPYSDEAVLQDKWARAWLLLEVDDHGVVSRLKLLKRPGAGLDDIAIRHGFGLRFDPARDPNGVPTKTYVLRLLEWPSHGWLVERDLPTTRMPVFQPTRAEGTNWADGRPMTAGKISRPAPISAGGVMWTATYPPCDEGQGISVGSMHPVLRDCSVPDLAKAQSVPWIERGVDNPAPVVAEAKRIDPAKRRADRLAAAELRRKGAIVATAATGLMMVGAVVAYAESVKYANRVDRETAMSPSAPRAQVDADKRTHHDWVLGSFGFAFGTAACAALSLHLWSRAAELSFQPGAHSGQVSYSGRF